MLIDFHEFAERNRKISVLSGRERVDAQRIFKPRDEYCKAEGVETAIRQYEILFERRQDLAVLPRHPFHLFEYG